MIPKQRIAAAKERIRKQGPCAFCGARFSFHREVDAQIARIVAGDSFCDTASDYGLTSTEMLAGWAALFDLLNEPPRGKA